LRIIIEQLVRKLPIYGQTPTNNFAERMIRFAVLWRKRSYGTKSDKGNRWVERILSLRKTCKLQGKSTFDVLVNAIAMDSYFKDRQPERSGSDWSGEFTYSP